jgi:PKD repeat protein
MALPHIYCVHASDAPQHVTRLTETLETLKSEKRIEGFSITDAAEGTGPVEKAGAGDLVIIVLTQKLEQRKKLLEDFFRDKTARSGVNVAEIIVDNIPYENEFITLPTDLMPIRSRDDMDTVWNNIAHNLRLMFPASQGEPTPPPDWRKYLKYLIPLALLVLLFIWSPWDRSKPKADFTADKTECEAPCTVSFSNASRNAESYEWDFGDGSKSTDVNPTHTFANAASYTVSLMAITAGNPDIKSVLINVTGAAPASFAVTAVTATVDNANFAGPCPHEFTFTAQIQVNNAGTVKYTWLRSDGATAPEQTLDFQGPGTSDVNTSWTLGAAGTNYPNMWQQLKVIAPNEMVSNQAVFNLTCDAPVASLEQDCLPFNGQNLSVQDDGGRWLVTDGVSRMMIFRTREKAEQAVNIMRHYQIDNQCFAVRPNPGLRYLTRQGTIPSGPFPGEDCIRINNPQGLTIRESGGSLFQVLDGDHIPFAAKSRAEAEKIIQIVKHFNAQYTCFVERPNPGMVYLRN